LVISSLGVSAITTFLEPLPLYPPLLVRRGGGGFLKEGASPPQTPPCL
jgi:hypothetical protein